MHVEEEGLLCDRQPSDQGGNPTFIIVAINDQNLKGIYLNTYLLGDGQI